MGKKWCSIYPARWNWFSVNKSEKKVFNVWRKMFWWWWRPINEGVEGSVYCRQVLCNYTEPEKKTFLYLLYLYLLCSMLVFLIIDLFPEARKKADLRLPVKRLVERDGSVSCPPNHLYHRCKTKWSQKCQIFWQAIPVLWRARSPSKGNKPDIKM